MLEATNPVSLDRLIFTVESMPHFLREGKPLFVKHYEEIAKDKDVFKLDEDTDYYQRNADAGKAFVVGARLGNKLVGYMIWHVHHHPHYKDVLCAQDDVHFLLPEYRRGLAGYLLLKNAIALLRKLGVQYCYVREKIGHEHPAVMKRLGLKPLDITYAGKLT